MIKLITISLFALGFTLRVSFNRDQLTILSSSEIALLLAIPFPNFPFFISISRILASKIYDINKLYERSVEIPHRMEKIAGFCRENPNYTKFLMPIEKIQSNKHFHRKYFSYHLHTYQSKLITAGLNLDLFSSSHRNNLIKHALIKQRHLFESLKFCKVLRLEDLGSLNELLHLTSLLGLKCLQIMVSDYRNSLYISKHLPTLFEFLLERNPPPHLIWPLILARYLQLDEETTESGDQLIKTLDLHLESFTGSPNGDSLLISSLRNLYCGVEVDQLQIDLAYQVIKEKYFEIIKGNDRPITHQNTLKVHFFVSGLVSGISLGLLKEDLSIFLTKVDDKMISLVDYSFLMDTLQGKFPKYLKSGIWKSFSKKRRRFLPLRSRALDVRFQEWASKYASLSRRRITSLDSVFDTDSLELFYLRDESLKVTIPTGKDLIERRSRILEFLQFLISSSFIMTKPGKWQIDGKNFDPTLIAKLIKVILTCLALKIAIKLPNFLKMLILFPDMYENVRSSFNGEKWKVICRLFKRYMEVVRVQKYFRRNDLNQLLFQDEWIDFDY